VTVPAPAPWVEGLSLVCHELRRPLTVIRGAATLLLEAHDQLPPTSRAQILRLMDQSVEAMSDLVDDLTVVVRLEAGELELTAEPIDVGELLESAAGALRKWHPDAELAVVQPPELVVEADREQCLRVLRALIARAGEGAPEGVGPTLSAEATDGQVRILVAVHGAAVEDASESWFEPFSRAGGDTGLALHMSRGLARLMGGDVALAVPPGGGSGFSFNLNRRV
jgi:two-component system sensor histidine kinase MtrB